MGLRSIWQKIKVEIERMVSENEAMTHENMEHYRREPKMRWSNEEIQTQIVYQNREQVEAMICPKCGEGKLLAGPRGGDAINVQCDKCGEKYWYGGPFGLRTMDEV